MSLVWLVLISAVVLVTAYRVYGTVLARLLRLDPQVRTPAVELRDDVDYVPIEPKFLISQHFSAIAAAGPVVGPIMAAYMFGWLPAVIWILVGSIFIGGVHDITSLTASIRHKARSIADVVREHMNRRSYLLFLLFIWIALVYIVVAFADIVADSFVGVTNLGAGHEVSGGAVASASLMYLALPVIMGLLLRFTKLSIGWATAIFLPLIALSVCLGPMIPLDLGLLLNTSDSNAQRIWGVLLLGYCFVASLVPMWLLLQPRGHLGGYFLFVILGGGMVGLIISGITGGVTTQYPAFKGWDFTASNGAVSPLAPILFITIACGACSGFHSIIASGTTSKQLRLETDAKPVAYGSMLMEAMVAILSVSCVMILAPDSTLISGKVSPDAVYANGIASFFGALGVNRLFAYTFVGLAFTTFVYDTLDVCTRLGRYILTELTGWRGRAGNVVATAITAGAPLVFLLMPPSVDPAGNVVPVWRVFWALFGASNQLLAALTLIGVTVWLWRTYRAWWVWPVAGVPMVFMYVMSAWALSIFIRSGFKGVQWSDPSTLPRSPVPWAALVLLSLALMVAFEALRVFFGGGPSDATPVDRDPLRASLSPEQA